VHKNSYTFFFAAAVTITCSLLLASAATLLRDRQQENEVLDMRKNILASVGISGQPGKSLERQEILRLYDQNIKSKVLNLEGQEVPDKKADVLDEKKDKDLLPLYYAHKNGDVTAYILPISGKGLWSTVYGYLALESDGLTVKGITFYKHGETPGLGGEIDKDWFKDNYKGKKIISPEGELVSVTIVKGKVSDRVPPSEVYHYVDGISGATLTGNGINQFLKADLLKYEPYLKQIRQE
jgi:Na+-transporting NADH:ubiquinone oxidoreductase subunit C